uniref:Uncharacterized protein n=1 Tax=Oryza rufipogon TaxID=4529 RepID=A0A0E0P5K6_ORYRU
MVKHGLELAKHGQPLATLSHWPSVGPTIFFPFLPTNRTPAPSARACRHHGEGGVPSLACIIRLSSSSSSSSLSGRSTSALLPPARWGIGTALPPLSGSHFSHKRDIDGARAQRWSGGGGWGRCPSDGSGGVGWGRSRSGSDGWRRMWTEPESGGGGGWIGTEPKRRRRMAVTDGDGARVEAADGGGAHAAVVDAGSGWGREGSAWLFTVSATSLVPPLPSSRSRNSTFTRAVAVATLSSNLMARPNSSSPSCRAPRRGRRAQRWSGGDGLGWSRSGSGAWRRWMGMEPERRRWKRAESMRRWWMPAADGGGWGRKMRRKGLRD